ncbi:DNRLRE domain-containing protein [Streptomyces sp. NPDC000594]|uniref:DNRLRE domain-containing protein n=1 Tax=Streptomyces sp. NPDC000594 TaxID=3154261 RepID=UPI0033189FB2
MTRTWRRMPGRRTTAALLVAAVAATGVTYAGLRLDDPDPPGTASKAQPKRSAAVLTEAAALRRAARTGKSVEVVPARTERSTTWARADGKLAMDLYATPVRAKSGGGWKPVDTTLRRTGRGWEPKVTSGRVVFSAGSRTDSDGSRTDSGGGSRTDSSGSRADSGERKPSPDRASRDEIRRVSLLPGAAPGGRAATTTEPASPLVTLHVGAHSIQLTWPGPVPAPIIDGPRALYPEIFPGADLVLTADNGGFAQLLVLKNRAAAANPRVQQLAYGISSPDLTFRLDPATGVLGAENADGEPVAYSPTPLMWDNKGAPAVTDGTVGSGNQPTEPESPDPVDTGTPEPEPSTGPTEEERVESDEQADPSPEALPTATDGPAPIRPEEPLPSAPGEPTPGPTHGGPAATLNLPALDGPSPDSQGELVTADLSDGQWTLTPDQDFLNNPETVYPVFIDPSVKEDMQNWTTAYNRHPKATFYNGRGFNKYGTHEARVGFESDTWGTSRSFFNFSFDKKLEGTKIESAKLTMLATYSWSCSPRSMSVHHTGPINSRTNWKNAPKLHDKNKLTTKKFALGYSSGCRDDFVTFDVRKAAQKQADKGEDGMTLGLRARDEDAQYAWKKFRANGEYPPKVTIVFNRKPNPPTKLDLHPDSECTTKAPYARMGSDDLSFSATASDPDGNIDFMDFDLWPTGKWDTAGDLLGATGKVNADSGQGTSVWEQTPRFPTSRLTNGTTYSWRVKGVDDANSSSRHAPVKTPCRFVLDLSAPKAPDVESDDYPNADEERDGFGSEAEDSNWSKKKFGSTGTFKLRARNKDVKRFEYGYNSASYTGSISPPRKDGVTSTVDWLTLPAQRPPTAGPNVLYVRTVDDADNVSQPTLYFFYVTPRDQADAPGDFTGDDLPDMMVVTKEGNLALYPSQSDKELNKGTGDLDYSMAGAYRANPDKDPNPAADTKAPFVAPKGGHFARALITHRGDIYGADGLQDLVVRVEDRLWIYPGDGYGAVNVDKRREILLPENAPSPKSFSQIIAAGDMTGDGRGDFVVRAGDELWALTGYHGGAIDEARRLAASAAWLERDLVSVQDITGDGEADIVYRTDASHRLLLRKGKAASGGGTDLDSLASEAASLGGLDIEYGASGWSRASIPFLMGVPDADGDAIPDVWTVRSDGSVRFYSGGRTVLAGSGKEVVAPAAHWKTRQAIG